ncbi:MAG: NUDIX hydrolase [Pseudomonadales bacterium]
MHRRLLINRLAQYQQRHPNETSVAQRILEVVHADPRCFERDCWLGHITGSAWILNQAGTHALLTHHKKLNRWLQLGGHSDGEPDTLQVAQREALEESGLKLKLCSSSVFDIDVHEIPARGGDPAHDHLDLRFLLQASDSDEFTVSEESNDLAWVDMDRIGDYTNEESVLRMVRKLPTFLHG